MDLRTYQKRVDETDRNSGTDERAQMIPLAGLVGEAGELLAEYKRYLRNGASPGLPTDRLAEEVGDLLWYVASVATKFGLDLEAVAEQNLRKCNRRWRDVPAREAFDAGYPADERLPRQFSVQFSTHSDGHGTPKIRVSRNGRQFGDDLNDNSPRADGYAYHDVIHLSFAAVLGWSPLVRKMMHAKRKSNSEVDRIEDGGRAIAIEEGLLAMIFAYAKRERFLKDQTSVSSELLRMITSMVSHLEVAVCTPREWERAIVLGFNAWREIQRRGSGIIDVDLDNRSISVREPGGGVT